MLRQNYVTEGIAKEYLNHNLHIKFSIDAVKDIAAGKISGLENLNNVLWGLDIEIIGDPECIGNDEMIIELYNLRSDRLYRLLLCRELSAKLKKGKTVILSAFIPDASDRARLDSVYCFE